MNGTGPYPGDKVVIKDDPDLGPIAGQRVEVLAAPDEDGMIRVRLVVQAWVAKDNIR